MIPKHLKDQIQELLSETMATDESDVMIRRRLQILMNEYNETPQPGLDGLTPIQMANLTNNIAINSKNAGDCKVVLNHLSKENCERVPLVRQALFIMNKLGEKELKLTRLGWLPLKIVAEAYSLGQPEFLIEKGIVKRICEYDAPSVRMSRMILEILGWVKTLKGVFSLTVKGKKALGNIEHAANDIILCALTSDILHEFDGNLNPRIGNYAIPYSLWLLGKYGDKWHTGDFYEEKYQKIFNCSDEPHIYALRVFSRLFYWLGIVERKEKSFLESYKMTYLCPVMFSFKK